MPGAGAYGRSGRAALAACLLALVASGAAADETLRGRFRVELEPVASHAPGDPYPLDPQTAHRWALDEAAAVFAGMVYGWSFRYDVGDPLRKIQENFEAAPLGTVGDGDPRMSATDAELEGSLLYIWADYRLDAAQERNYQAARQGDSKGAQAVGSAPISDGRRGKAAALEDALRLAVRSLLKGTEKNRPKGAEGRAVLIEVPRYWVDAGRYQCAARFRVVVVEVVPHRIY